MGDTTGDGRKDEQPPHPVTLSRYWMAPRLVTAEQYCEFLNDCGWVKLDEAFIVPKDATHSDDTSWGTLVNLPFSPIELKLGRYVPRPGLEHKPMYYVTWEGAAYYCNWLSQKQGLSACYLPKQNWTWNRFAGGYHLPTEAQWECAARAGQSGRTYPWGDQVSPRLANYANQVGHITDVGAYPPNPCGLHDLAGNVMEWCQDWYDAASYAGCDSGTQNPVGPPDVATQAAQMRALRGAMYYHPLSFHTCSRRYGTSDTKGCFSFNGFRVVREDPASVQDFAGPSTSERGTTREMQTAKAWFAGHFHDEALPLSFTLDGQASARLLQNWKFTCAEANAGDGKRKQTITAADPKSGLELSCEVTLFERFPAVDWVVRVTNRSAKDSPLLENLQVLDESFVKPESEKREFILRHSRGSRAWSDDFIPTDTLLPPDSHFTLGGHGGRSSDSDLPFMNLQWGNGGAVLAVGWTGQWQARFERGQANAVRVQAGMERLRTRLLPGESIRTPRVLVCFWDGQDMLRGHNLFRQLILAHYTPRVDGEPVHPPIALSSAGLNGYTEANQLAAIPKLKERGIETLWIDAGWFVGGWPNGAGTWQPKPDCFPRGFGPVGEAAHAAGLKFLVWFELERVSQGSRLAREHPEWVIGPITEYGGLLNLGIPAARRWLTDLVSEQLASGKIDVLRQDMNMEPLGYWLRNDSADRLGMTESKFVEGLYALFDELRSRHPGLWIDDCASGGRNIDLEMLMRGIPLWQSDAQCVPFAAEMGQMQNNGLNLYLPMHSGGTGCKDGAQEPSYGFRSTLSAGNPESFDANAPAAPAQRSVQTCLRTRPFFAGDYYPLFAPTPALHRWFGYQLHRPDLNQGMIMVFRRAQCPQTDATVLLHGLQSERAYRLTDQETGEARELDGKELATLLVKVPQAPGSRLLLYETR
jgi:alpha-galactosidase